MCLYNNISVYLIKKYIYKGWNFNEKLTLSTRVNRVNFDFMSTLNWSQCILGSSNSKKNMTVMWFAGGRSMITSKAMIKPSLTARSSQYTSVYFPFSSRNALYLPTRQVMKKRTQEENRTVLTATILQFTALINNFPLSCKLYSKQDTSEKQDNTIIQNTIKFFFFLS